ncbi:MULTISPECIES: hypothetical protein [Acinetobacter]|jgi:hypothetical protein|uniref:Uncharacterized protein n=1 Tax=Acinetobacter parvus NIPH 1103 TaxID=1217671 RepID=N8RHB5_9GAMM|nr:MULTISPECIES: hypothetical protein [Acinetobacter]ENU34798.1 hypothetical protein F989_00153 [Acinetobacter parvus NIPH 1103]MDH1006831.1 hypothetical protein [Acinetobacter junii]MDH1801576.1 hypothetical protein [Acinetobacter johnsonii]
MNLDLSFEVVNPNIHANKSYSKGCTSGGSSGCCTAICSGGCKPKDGQDSSSMEAWEQYLEINAGVLQY